MFSGILLAPIHTTQLRMKRIRQSSKLGRAIFQLAVPIGLFGLLAFMFGAVFLHYYGSSERNKEKVLRVSEAIAAELSAQINGALSASEVLANSFSTLGSRRSQVNSLLQVVLMQNQNFEGVYSIWEPNEFDQMDTAFVGLQGHDETGRFMPYWTRNEYGMVDIQASVDYETSVIGDYYVVPKKTLQKAVIDPFLFTSKGKEVYMFALVAPIKYGRNFYGVTGINIRISTVQAMLLQRKYLDGLATVRVFSNNGTYVAATDEPNLMGRNVAEIQANSDQVLSEITKAIQSARLDGMDIIAKSPVIALGLYTPWMVEVRVPSAALVDTDAGFRFWFSLLLVASIWLSLMILLYWHIRRKTLSLNLLQSKALDFAVGKVNTAPVLSNDEVQSIAELIDTRYRFEKKIETFLDNVVVADYTHRLEPISAHDSLSNKLNLVFEVLETRRAEYLARLELAEQQKWVREGIAHLNKVLRTHYSSLEQLSENVVRVVVDYLGINQGGIFLLVDKEQRKPYLELAAAYAYNRVKALERKVNLGDGIVGTCALEREITYLTEIPDSYPLISSGMGGALPKAILVAPLTHENMVYGVMELASFSEFQQKEIDLLRDILEPIAAAIASVRVNAKTAALLAEMQKQKEEFLEQERILREDLASLKATHERSEITETRLRRQLEGMKLDNLRLRAGVVYDTE